MNKPSPDFRGVVIIDTDHELGRDNRCFDPDSDYGYGTEVMPLLARQAAGRGWRCMTGDRFLQAPQRPAFLITDMISKNTPRLLAQGAIPAICSCAESPRIAWYFYHRLPRYAGHYRHSILFSGVRRRLANTSTIFHPLRFPMNRRDPLPFLPWKEREHLVLFNANKAAASYPRATCAQSLRSLLRWLRLRVVLPLIDPWMRCPDLYRLRLRALEHFAPVPDFALYGHGWDSPIPYGERRFRSAVAQCWRGSIEPYEKKREILQRFRFALCFENTVFPGYVTEKLFDCLLAGCIPVYLGAPDISGIVPPDAYIDFRQFRDFGQMERHLRALPESALDALLTAGRAYLASDAFSAHFAPRQAEMLLDLIEQTAAHPS